MKDFIERQIIGAVRKLLSGRVNEQLGELECYVPLVEFFEYSGGSSLCTVISLASCEQSEKERIIWMDAYSLSISFYLPDTSESEYFIYAYSGAVSKALFDDPTLGGIVDRAVITGKKYLPPKKFNCGGDWELVITLRVTIDGINK